MKGPVQMASFALLWNKIKISFHLTLEPMGDFWAWMTISDGLVSELHEYETDYSGWAPSGTVENRWGIRSPVESILWNICFIQTTPLDGSDSSMQSLGHVQLFATPWIAARQASLSITNSRSSLKLMSIEAVMPFSHLVLYHPLLLLPQIAPSIRVFSNLSQLFPWGGQSIGVSSSGTVLPMNTRTGLLQDGLVGSPCSPRYSQASSPTPQFKSINSLALSLFHSPTVTSIHDHWKNHSLD